MDGLIFNDEASIANVPGAVPDDQQRRADDHGTSAPTSRRSSSCPRSPRANCTSRSATPSPARAPTSRRCAPPRCATATTTSINGQKMWTSLIAYADYVWLAVRTNPEAKKHRGISMLIMPTTAEGFSWTPVHTMSGVDTSATYYQDVRIPTSQPGRRGERRLEAGHQPAQPRTRRPGVGPADLSPRSTPSANGRRTPRTPTATG